MVCITKQELANLETQVIQYQIQYDVARSKYQFAYDKNRSGGKTQTGTPPNERDALAIFFPIRDKLREAEKTRDDFKKMEICEEIQKRRNIEAHTKSQEITSQKIKDLEAQLSTEKETLSDYYFIGIAGIILIVILFLRRRA